MLKQWDWIDRKWVRNRSKSFDRRSHEKARKKLVREGNSPKRASSNYE